MDIFQVFEILLNLSILSGYNLYYLIFFMINISNGILVNNIFKKILKKL